MLTEILDDFYATPDDFSYTDELADAELRLDDAADGLEDVLEALYETGDTDYLEQGLDAMARVLGVVMPNKRLRVRPVSPLFNDMCAIMKEMK